jgi:hypothetical protein
MAERKVIDFTEEKKVSVIKEQARQSVLNDIWEFLTQRYEKVGRVGSNQVAVVAGVAKDDDGFENDVVVVFDATTKPWYDRKVNDKGIPLSRPVVRYDFADEVEAYEKDKGTKKAPKK